MLVMVDGWGRLQDVRLLLADEEDVCGRMMEVVVSVLGDVLVRYASFNEADGECTIVGAGNCMVGAAG